MSVSLRPRHPAEVAASRSVQARREKSLVVRFQSNSMLTVAPAILLALAVYVGLVYVNKIARRVSRAADEPSRAEQYVRGVDGVVKDIPILEQEPPPSPELVRDSYLRAHQEPVEVDPPEIPILIPQLEETKVPLPKVTLEPLEAPPVGHDLLVGNSP